MLERVFGIRRQDRKDAIVAFVTLFGAMTGHAVLETARDAVFLSALPASRLPWAYVAIAVLSLAVSGASRALRGRLSRYALSLVLLLGGLGTAAFHWLVAADLELVYLSLYVWTGLLASAITVEFWLQVAESLDFGQAKRLFAVIGAGGLSGAVVGALLSFAVLEVWPARSLLLVSGGILSATALSAAIFPRAAAELAPIRKDETALTLLRKEPYVLRLLLVVLASSMLLTGVDFLFKATAATDLAPDQLGPFFARFYAVTGALALVVQLVVAPRLLRVLGVNTSLLLLPVLILLGSLGFLAAAGLGTAMILRGADGALRHSLHRTGIEILHVPLATGVRERFKSIVEGFGQRGGQAIASLLLLGALTWGATSSQIGLGLTAVAVLWLVLMLGIRPHYVELFRKTLREGFLETHLSVPDLDLHSLEALIAALSSENDHEVLAALDLLAAYGKSNLVPALILYHPSAEVVLRAFALLRGTERTDVDRLVGRLMDHEDERVRGAALRDSAARSGVELLQQMSTDPAPVVRTTALVELVRRGAIDEWKGGDLLRGIIDGGSPELRRALASAARDLPRGRYSWALIRLAFLREPGLQVEVVRSMAAAPDVEYVPALVRLLAERECREHARAAILGIGDVALTALGSALADPALPRSVRRHLPRTIARFGGEAALAHLEGRLAVETDEVVELKILRALGRVRAGTKEARVDERALMKHAERSLTRAVSFLHHRAVLARSAEERVADPSQVGEVLLALLADKETGALERTFRTLSVLNPREDFETLFAALGSSDPRLQNSGRELAEHIVPEPLRAGILAMYMDASMERRLSAAARWRDPPGRARFEQVTSRLALAADAARAKLLGELSALHVESLRTLVLDPSDALRGVASYRIAELGLEELESELRSSAFSPTGALGELSAEALSLLERQSEASRAG